MQVSPSILASNLIDLKNTLKQLNPKITNYIHLDVMDGHFVPSLTFGEAFASHVKEATSIPLDIHLMVEYPEKEIPKYFTLKPNNITFHYEATKFPIRMAQWIQENHIKAGLAINPATHIQEIEPLLPYFDIILIMSVDPGYYGQKFLPHSIEKIKQLNNFRKKIPIISGDEYFLIQVDGGVNVDNKILLQELGVDIVVAGSFVFKSNEMNEQIQKLKN